MRQISLLFGSMLCAVSICASAGDHHDAHWTYEGRNGAEHWGDMQKEFAACKLSKEQSPINIEVAKTQKAKLAPIAFSYAAGAAEIVNNGHTIQVNLPAGGSIKLGQDEYQLLQFHFHTPSEEKINGKNYPLVAHFVHKNGDGKLAVVAVLMKEGKENAALKSVFAGLPAKEGDKTALAMLNPAEVLPATQAYYSFMGSLTTPPCSDDVRWQVLQQPVEVSKQQIAAFRALYKMNARPVQPLNGRVVQASE